MPHIILEYSANIPKPPDFKQIFSAVHTALVATGHFAVEDIRSRAYRVEDFHLGDGLKRRAFVHVTLSILEGRTVDARRQASNAVLLVLQEQFANATRHLQCDFSIEVRELETASYSKIRV